MIVYRIATKKYCRDLSGMGSEKVGGRWNRRGIKALYTSEHRSLSLLEMLARSGVRQFPDEYVIVEINVPDDFPFYAFSPDKLPKNWDAYPPDSFTVDAGTEILKSNTYGFIKVPCSLMHEEYNFILNPDFPRYSEVTIVEIKPLHLDERLQELSAGV